jgi:uncharacterized protein
MRPKSCRAASPWLDARPRACRRHHTSYSSRRLSACRPTGGTTPFDQQVGEQSDRRPLYLYGSTARDGARAASDVDLFVDYGEDGDFSAIELVRIKRYVSELLRTDADVTTRDGLPPLIRDEIVASAEKIF